MASISQDAAMGTLITEMGDFLRTSDNKYQILLLKTIFKKILSKVKGSDIPDLRDIFEQIVNNVSDKESASKVVKLMKNNRFKINRLDLLRLRL